MSPAHITIEQNVEALKRYAWLERAAMRALAGWLPGVPEWEAKNAFGLHIWESAEAVDILYSRLRELRTYQPERDLSPLLLEAGQALAEAQTTAEVAAGVYGVVKKQLADAFRQHADRTWGAFDNPTIRAIERLLPALDAQVAWAEAFLPQIADRYPDVQPWVAWLNGLLAADGGIAGDGPKAGSVPARPPGHDNLLPWKTCQRMPDWPIFDPEADIQPDRDAEPEAYRLWRFKHYLNEMTAAETLGSLLWMLPEMPWEFQHNVARHLWDELRHSQLGQTRIRQLGLKDEEVPQVVQIYNVMMRLPPVEQYALLTTVIEPNGMPEKTTNRAHWEAIDDEISAAAVSYDWSDENFHVRWGKRWTPVLLETYGYAETPDQIRTRMEAWLMENTPVRMQQNHVQHTY
jgi:hypothetical protein